MSNFLCISWREQVILDEMMMMMSTLYWIKTLSLIFIHSAGADPGFYARGGTLLGEGSGSRAAPGGGGGGGGTNVPRISWVLENIGPLF